MARHTIILFRSANGWMAKHTDPSIRDLFGSDTLPTAFTPYAAGPDVRAEIQRLNPDCEVILRLAVLPVRR